MKNKLKKIFITGGCGYKGSVLIPKLLDKGYSVTSIDTEWFGNYLKPHKNLELIKPKIPNIFSIVKIKNCALGDKN